MRERELNQREAGAGALASITLVAVASGVGEGGAWGGSPPKTVPGATGNTGAMSVCTSHSMRRAKPKSANCNNRDEKASKMICRYLKVVNYNCNCSSHANK